jgi:histidinol phosphatase-like PHP family hydrolase
MSWRPVDCHAHTNFSDGALTIAQVVERAASLNVVPSVADHISRDVARAVDSVDAAFDYIAALEQYDVLRGGEFCWHDSLWRELPEDLVARFTHRLGSLHAVRLPNGDLVHAFSRRLPGEISADDYMWAHLDSLETLAREMPVDILSHPTLVTLPFRQHPTDELWTEEREERMVEALFSAGISFEISNRYRPHERLVKRAVDRGVRISLGSDGHTWEQVADIAAPLAMARRLGVRDEDIYDPRRHGSKTAVRA